MTAPGVMLPVLDPTAAAGELPAVLAESLAASARVLVAAPANVRRRIDILSAAGLSLDAARVLVAVLPKRALVQWAVSCLALAPPAAESLRALDETAAEHVSAWLDSESEDARLAALRFAEEGKFAGPAHWVAAAAGWSGGSLAPPGGPLVVPPDQLVGEAVLAAVRGLAVRDPKPHTRLAAMVALALRQFGVDPAGKGS